MLLRTGSSRPLSGVSIFLLDVAEYVKEKQKFGSRPLSGVSIFLQQLQELNKFQEECSRPLSGVSIFLPVIIN